MEIFLFLFAVLILLANFSYYVEFDVVPTERAYGIRENQILFGITIYREVVLDRLTYKQAVIKCNKLNQK